MKLTVKFSEINYGDAAVKAMPLLAQAAANQCGTIRETVEAFSQLPEPLIYQIFDTIPVAQKNSILASFAADYRTKILDTINKTSQEHSIGVLLSDFSMSLDMELTAQIRQLDYFSIVDRFLPMIREKLLSMGGMTVVLRPLIKSATAEQICGLMDRILGDNKDSFVASLLDQNQKILIDLIEDAAKKQKIRLRITSLSVQA